MRDFIVGKENEVLKNPDYVPTTAFVVVESEKGFMLLYNKFYKRWEIPGGYMETDESPRDGAIRECKEESNQIIADLKFLGIAKYSKMNAAIYYAFLKEESPFAENDEISKLKWWKLGEKIAGETDADSIKFIEIYGGLNLNQKDLVNELTEKSSLSQIQEYNEKVVVLRGFSNESIQETMLALLEETGELAKAIRQTATNMVVDADKIHNYDASVKDEAADVFAILMTICSKLNINLHNAFVEKEKKNCERIWSAER